MKPFASWATSCDAERPSGRQRRRDGSPEPADRTRLVAAIGRLWAAWESALDDIAATPRRFSPVEDALLGREVRFCLILKARYRITFQVLPDEVRVVAFGRSNRSDDFWLGQLSTS